MGMPNRILSGRCRHGSGFRVWSLGFRTWSLGFRVYSQKLRVSGLGGVGVNELQVCGADRHGDMWES